MAASAIKVNANVNFVLFKNPFVAALEKDEEAMMLLLAPSSTEGRKSITVGEMIDEVKKLLGKGDEDEDIKKLSADLESNLSNVAEIPGPVEAEAPADPAAPDEEDPDAPVVPVVSEGETGVKTIRFTIEQAFLYYEKRGAESSTEYAFSLSVDTSKLLREVGIFQLKGASISVWNTDRKKILDSMKMFGIQDFLDESEQTA